MRRPSRGFFIALALFALSLGWLMQSTRTTGIARDEVVYMHSGSRYASYWQKLASGKEGALSKRVITEHFGGKGATANNREHPPLMKTLFGFSRLAFHEELGWLSEISAYRLPTLLCQALLIALVFVFTGRRWGTGVGLIAALLLLCLPRAFFHSTLATFDAPVVLFWFLSLWGYLWARTHRWGFVPFGLALGLSLATKHNAIMLPAVFLPHFAYAIWRDRDREAKRPLIDSARRAPWQLWLGPFVVGPLLLISLWPWLWFDTLAHVKDWLSFHFRHVHYNYEYLGRNWNAPPFPWHIALVTTALTVPIGTLASSVVGAGIWGRALWRNALDRRSEDAGLVLILSLGVAMGPFFLRSTPIFGAEKHWAAAMVSICIFASLGLWAMGVNLASWVRTRVQAAWALHLARCGLASLVITVAAWQTQRAHPYSLSDYSGLAGGAKGGADLGMNRQFWGYAVRGVLPFLNQFASTGSEVPVYTHDASPAWGLYRKSGLVEPSLVDAGREEAGIRRSKIALVVHEKHFRRHDFLIWKSYGTVQPSYVLRHRGVPIVSVYLRPELQKHPQP